MFIKKLILKKYIPHMSGGIQELSVDIKSPVTIIIGQNNSGKSTTFNQLHPYAKSTNIFSKGLNYLEIEHKNNIFILESNFTRSNNNHSFLLNNEELNKSNISTIQNTLVEEHLGYTALIHSLSHGKILISNLGKAERKKLFMEANPVNIGFILQYHKKISKDIRTFNNQLSLLKTREIDLKQKLMDKNILDNINKHTEELKNKEIELSKVIYLLEQQLSELINNPLDDYDLEDEKVAKNLSSILNNFKPQIVLKNEQPIITHLSGQKQYYDYIKSSIQDNLSTLKEEVDNYEKNENLNINKELEDYTFKLNSLNKVIEKINYNDKIPYIDLDNRINIENRLDELTNLLHIIRNVDKVINLEQLKDLEDEYTLINNRLSIISREINHLNDLLNNYKTEYTKIGDNPYPEDCNRKCNIRINIKEKVDELTKLTTSLKNKLKDLEKDKIELEEKKEQFKDNLSKYDNTYKNAFTKINSFIDRYYLLSEYILNKDSLLKTLNKDPFSIKNKLIEVIENSKERDKLYEVNKEKESIEFKIKTLRETNLKELENITKIYLDKKEQLIKYNKKLDNLNDKIKIKNDQINLVNESLERKESFNKLQLQLKRYYEYLIYEKTIEFYKTTIKKFNEYKLEILEEITEKNKTIKTQNEYITRLDQEILPNIKDLEDKLEKWELINKVISPDGIPKRHNRVFINKIIDIVNNHLECVWTNTLKIKKIRKNQDIDFNFKVIVKNDIVSDISLCSSSQKDMINLAFQLAIMEVTGWNKEYPFFIDECDAYMSEYHKSKVLELIIKLIREKRIMQLFFISHSAALMGIPNAEVVCLDDTEMVVPESYNNYTTIIR
jgi:predicted ATPase